MSIAPELYSEPSINYEDSIRINSNYFRGLDINDVKSNRLVERDPDNPRSKYHSYFELPDVKNTKSKLEMMTRALKDDNDFKQYASSNNLDISAFLSTIETPSLNTNSDTDNSVTRSRHSTISDYSDSDLDTDSDSDLDTDSDSDSRIPRSRPIVISSDYVEREIETDEKMQHRNEQEFNQDIESLFKWIDTIRWVDKSEGNIPRSFIKNNKSKNEISRIFATLLRMSDVLAAQIEKKTGAIGDMSTDDDKYNFLFHVIMKGSQFYYNMVVPSPEMCIYLYPNEIQPVFTLFKKELKVRNLDNYKTV